MSEISLPASYKHCQQITILSAKNFHYSFLTLSKQHYQAMCALYAFMRYSDDLADDESLSLELRMKNIENWRQLFLSTLTGNETLAGGTSAELILPALIDTMKRFSISEQYFLDVIKGMEMDLHPVSLQTFQELENYCYHAAGAVGICCIHIWGFHNQQAIAIAKDCGTALQLTNILRDLAEDSARGRCYLPREDLERFHAVEDVQQRNWNAPACKELLQFQCERARDYYHRAEALFNLIEPAGWTILRTMLSIYGGILTEIERRNYNISERVELSKFSKLQSVFSAICWTWWRRCLIS